MSSHSNFAERNMWKKKSGRMGGGSYTRLKVLDQGISFLTETEPSANV